MKVEIVFGDAAHQELLEISVADGATVAAAIEESGIAARFPEHEVRSLTVGIWGRIVQRDQPLSDGDRIEIYRELKIDPRDARRRLAAQGKVMGGSDTKPQTSRNSAVRRKSDQPTRLPKGPV